MHPFACHFVLEEDVKMTQRGQKKRQNITKPRLAKYSEETHEGKQNSKTVRLAGECEFTCYICHSHSAFSTQFLLKEIMH